MKNFIVYNEVGKILRTGACQDSDFDIQATDNENIIEGIADYKTQYINNNVIVDMPVKPNGEYVFNYDTKHWEFDAVTADLKAKQERDRLLARGPDRINPIWWSSMSVEEQEAWTQYRQDLLDITSQADYPATIVWPIKP